MEPNSLKWVGSSCGLHGPYIFYKAFKFHQEAKTRILSLGDFFFVRCKPEEPICIAELQLLWEERTSKQLLSSSKLYFLPEDTPQGKTVTHGEHEVIAVSEKVIVRLQDLVKWSVPDSSIWRHGLKVEPLKPAVLQKLGTNGRREALHRYRESTWTSGLNFKDVQRERAKLGQEEDGRKVLVLSYPQYCRYRSLLVRLQEQPSSLLLDHTVLALGGIAALGGATKILYCRDTFEHPSLLHNDSICDQFAPNLKGRPRKKKLSVSLRRESQSQTPSTGQSSSGPCQGPTVASAPEPCPAENKAPIKVKPSCKVAPNGKMPAVAKQKANNLSKKCVPEEKERIEEKEKRQEQEVKLEQVDSQEEEVPEEERAEEQAFLVELYKYMKERDTPIERIPFLGFKQINLWTMFHAAQKLGGYELITVRRQWKHVYDELGGNPSSTSAATCTRRHYERLLLPYERHIKGEQDKPLPVTKPRKPEGGQEKAPGAKLKGLGPKKPKTPNNFKQVKKERGDATEQELNTKEELHSRSVVITDEPIVIEEEELHLTLKEETLSAEQASLLCPKEPDYRSHHSGRPLITVPCPPSEWRQISEALQAKLTCEQQTEGHFIHKNPYLPHRWDHHKPAAHIALPETTSRVKDSLESHGGRIGMVLPMCKQLERQSGDSSSEEDYSVIKKESAAYKSSQGVMSPLAKKKLLSQVCESNTFAFSLQLPLPQIPSSYSSMSLSERDAERRNEESGQRQSSDSMSEVPTFRPSVIQHAQSTKAQHTSSSQLDRGSSRELSEAFGRSGRHIPAQVNAPWQPFLPQAQSQDGSEQDKLVQQSSTTCQSRSYTRDCYSSPHLNSLYRQTETCLSQDQISGFTNGECRREQYSREREGGQGFIRIEPEGLAYRSHYTDRSQDSREANDEPKDFSISKHRVSSVPKSSFCGLSYPIIHQSLESHPKACKVSPMTVSPSKQTSDSQQSFPSPKTSESSPSRLSKRSVADDESEDAPQRKVRVVTPIHPIAVSRRSDPEELKAAEPTHAVHLSNHMTEGQPTTTYPHPHSLYQSLYAPGSLVSSVQEIQHPSLQYLKSQSAVSPLVPPLAFHSMMLHRQLMAASPSAHPFYRHPGGATLYGDLLHHLYPLSTLPPPQLSSVHPSTRL